MCHPPGAGLLSVSPSWKPSWRTYVSGISEAPGKECSSFLPGYGCRLAKGGAMAKTRLAQTRLRYSPFPKGFSFEAFNPNIARSSCVAGLHRQKGEFYRNLSSGGFSAEPAAALRCEYLTAGKRRHLEYRLEPERRRFVWLLGACFTGLACQILVRLVIHVKYSPSGYCKSAWVNLTAHPTPAVVLQLGTPGPAPVELVVSVK